MHACPLGWLIYCIFAYISWVREHWMCIWCIHSIFQCISLFPSSLFWPNFASVLNTGSFLALKGRLNSSCMWLDFSTSICVLLSYKAFVTCCLSFAHHFSVHLIRNKSLCLECFCISVARPLLILFCYRKQISPWVFWVTGIKQHCHESSWCEHILALLSPYSLGFSLCYSKWKTKTIVWAHRFEIVFMFLRKQAVITGQTGLWWSAQCPRRNESFFCVADCSKCTRYCSAWVGYILTLNAHLALLLFPVCVMDDEESKRKYPT